MYYMIKESNFNRLRGFKDNYRLVRAEIFSSGLFRGTGSTKFPILVALYERNNEGMSFDYIKNFRFRVLGGDQEFILSKYQSTDGYINKYPPRKKDPKRSPLGLYYYTFRDINSLKKNTAFMNKQHYNGIVVTVENFYKYAYLFAFKMLFQPANIWLYGNLSPLLDVQDLEKNKEQYVLYAIKANPVLKGLQWSSIQKITDFYGIKDSDTDSAGDLEKTIKYRLNDLVGAVIKTPVLVGS